MALIKCPECKQDVSDQAVSCPHCGSPLKSEESVEISNIPNQNFKVELEFTNKKWKRVILLAWAILILGAMLTGSPSSKGDSQWFGIVLMIISIPVWIIGKIGAWYSNR